MADPKDIIPPPEDPTVLDRMGLWHASMGDAIYAAQSCWFGGHPVTRETAEQALANLERCEDSREWELDDAIMLSDLREHLQAHGSDV